MDVGPATPEQGASQTGDRDAAADGERTEAERPYRRAARPTAPAIRAARGPRAARRRSGSGRVRRARALGRRRRRAASGRSGRSSRSGGRRGLPAPAAARRTSRPCARAAGGGLVEHGAEGVDVGRGPDVHVTLELLGRHVVRRADERSLARQGQRRGPVAERGDETLRRRDVAVRARDTEVRDDGVPVRACGGARCRA